MCDCWPEQDAIGRWWRKVRQELEESASEYRIEVEKREAVLREALQKIVDEIDPSSDPGPALNFCRQTAQRALGLAPDAEPISFTGG